MSALLSAAAYLDPQRARDLSAFDATLRAIHEAAQDADTIAGERTANEDWLQEQFLDAAANGIATRCHFAKFPSGKVPTIGEVLLETLVESNSGLRERLAAMLVALAKDGDALASELLRDAGKEFARSEA